MQAEEMIKIQSGEYSWIKSYPTKYYEMDFKMVLKPSALLNLLQDVATLNAEELGFGYSFTHPKNYGWFLIKYHMEFDDYPQNVDEIVIKTEPRGVSKIVAFRDFEIWTSDEKIRLGRASSQWMMVDLNTKSIVPLAKTLDMMPAYEKRENDLLFNKISAPETIDYTKNFEIRYDDIDVNQHVNNANYIVWAFETLPYEFKAKYKLKTLDIVYKKEIAFGHNIVSSLELNKETNISTHILKNQSNDEELCLVRAEWA